MEKVRGQRGPRNIPPMIIPGGGDDHKCCCKCVHIRAVTDSRRLRWNIFQRVVINELSESEKCLRKKALDRKFLVDDPNISNEPAVDEWMRVIPHSFRLSVGNG